MLTLNLEQVHTLSTQCIQLSEATCLQWEASVLIKMKEDEQRLIVYHHRDGYRLVIAPSDIGYSIETYGVEGFVDTFDEAVQLVVKRLKKTSQ